MAKEERDSLFFLGENKRDYFMRKRAKTAILLIGALFLTAYSAGETETGELVQDGTVKSEMSDEAVATEESEPEELTGELTILSWVPYNNWQYVIEDFTKEHPGVTITVDTPREDELLTEEYIERYTTRIIAGDGFDIVESNLTNMERCVAQELFVDLYKLMDGDEEFQREDYFSCIFEPMEIDGKLPAFVYNVKPVYIHLNKKLLEKAGLEYAKDSISFKELYELYEKVREHIGENIFMTDSSYGYEGMSAYEDEFFIRNNLMDSEEYEEYLQMRHNLYYTSEKRSDWHDGTMKIADDVLCCASDLRLPSNNANDVFAGTENMTGALLYESMHGEHYFYGASTVSISSFSSNKELAWEFIKYAFSDKDIGYNFSSIFSPNKSKMKKMCEDLTLENREKLFQDIEAIDTMSYADMSLYYSLESIYDDYFVNNTITAKECCKELASRVYLYRNE